MLPELKVVTHFKIQPILQSINENVLSAHLSIRQVSRKLDFLLSLLIWQVFVTSKLGGEMRPFKKSGCLGFS
jgi:hypothetical protein